MNTATSLLTRTIAAVLVSIVLASSALAAERNVESMTPDIVAMEYFSNAWILISKEGIEDTPREIGLTALRSAFLIFVSRNGLKNAATDKVDAQYLAVIHRFVSAATKQEIEEYIESLFLDRAGKTTIDGRVVPHEELAKFYQEFLRMKAMPEAEVAKLRRAAMEHAKSKKKRKQTDQGGGGKDE